MTNTSPLLARTFHLALLLAVLPACGADPDPRCEGQVDGEQFCAGDEILICFDGQVNNIFPCTSCTQDPISIPNCEPDPGAFYELSVVQTYPSDDATGVALDIVAAIEMDAGFQPDEEGGVQLFLGDEQVPGMWAAVGESTDEPFYIWGFQPDEDLEPDSVYTAVLPAGATMPSVELDRLGYEAGGTRQDISWTFTTEANPDLSVLSSVPASGATVAQPSTIVVTFSEAINRTSVTPSTVFLTDDFGSDIGGNRIVEGNTVTFETFNLLGPGTGYTLTFNTDVIDINGMGPATDIEIAFTTLPALDWVGMTPADGSTNVSIDTPLTVTFNAPIDPSTVANDSIKPRPNRLMMDQGVYNVPGTTTVDGNTLTFVPTPGDWQEYETTYEILFDSDLRGINGERLNSPDHPEFTTPFFDGNRNYTVHTNGGGRSQSLDITTDQFVRAHFTSEVGTHPTSRWAFDPYGDNWLMWNINYGSSNILAGKTNSSPAVLENRVTIYQNQVWEIDSYGGHPSFTQGRGESPSLYYLKTQQWGDTLVLTSGFDSSLGLQKAFMSSPTGSINQLFWFKRRLQ